MKKHVLEYLEESARRYPSRRAYEDISKSYTFEEVSRVAKAIGSGICKAGLYKKPVAVLMKKSASMIAGFLGILYGGCFYCPIDVTMPLERIQAALSLLEPGAILTEEALKELAESLGLGCPVYLFEELCRQPEDEMRLMEVRRQSTDTDLIYVLFTSGSTGVPKGVGMSHRVIINNMEWLEKEYCFTANDVLGNQAPLYFDISVHDIYCPLKFGCSTVIIPGEHFVFPIKLIPFLNEHHITAIFWAPFALITAVSLKALEIQAPEYLRFVFFAGEEMPVKPLNYWRKYVPDALYVNMYGSTETHVCTYYNLSREYGDEERLPIGRPCSNIDVLVLDDKEELVLPGTERQGELCIRGCAMASGYYNDREKTAERFVQNPMNSHYPEIIYRTGDWVSYQEDGELLYHGRMDFQIKRLGYRIELGEIETAALGVKGIEACACVYHSKKQTIFLFYTGKEIDKKEISQGLSQRIPKYMLPGRYVYLLDMPRNANGKIDRKKLRELYVENT
ncbi:amino acid adenylation domain-containing protein [Lachnospiraceae bacterium 62-35]